MTLPPTTPTTPGPAPGQPPPGRPGDSCAGQTSPTPNPDVNVRVASSQDIARLAAVIAYAFLDDMIGAWLVPNRRHRWSVLRAYGELLLRQGLTQGRVDTTRELSAVAVWHPCTQAADEPVDLTDLAAATGRYARRFALLHAILQTGHPMASHEHLTMLAVTPDQRHTGIGTTLLTTHRHSPADTPTHAHATGRSRSLFRRLAYTSATPRPLPPHGPALHPMWHTPPTHPEPHPAHRSRP